MRRIILLSVLLLCGCINIYGPEKSEGQENKTTAPDSTGMDASVQTLTIGNRTPQELIAVVIRYYQQAGVTPTVRDSNNGIIAASGDAPGLAGKWLDCGSYQAPEQLTLHYRLVTQVWAAAEGSHVMIQVSGLAGKIASDGNDKVKPQECSSSGIFETRLEELLRK
ncbi:hypothetical protein [Tatumella citrea]|uniref:Lipoprotein n=1 Tax=Tatumella citrea TaxID=53336 RepID=A0A1Y0LH07_TATCI|nr:hypothetical protein [Tatumella citrea]ARU93333.1 hypothetical protein A7K98_05740 [Tatumella citrea]ARU97371.1 hypothetical protein A7K99_05740 [Tatumella citrea]